jgi:hypothetical protein
MKNTSRGPATTLSTNERLRSFIAKFEPKDQRLIRAVRSALRRRLPSAFELVYDNYNFFVIGYGPTERPSDAVLSIAAGTSGVGICFIHGAKLPDPEGILLGGGKQTRFVRVPSVSILKQPAVHALIDAAVTRGKDFPASGRGELIIRSVSARQRPRRRQARTGVA